VWQVNTVGTRNITFALVTLTLRSLTTKMNLLSYPGGVVLATVSAFIRSLGGTRPEGLQCGRSGGITMYSPSKTAGFGLASLQTRPTDLCPFKTTSLSCPNGSPAHKLACLFIVLRIKRHSWVGGASASPPIS
jgi:hypothetical protein